MFEAGVNDALLAAVGRVAGMRVATLEPLAHAGGFSPALRLRARFAGGATAFVKVATNDSTAEWIHRETAVYETLGDQPFLARFGGAGDADGVPFLLLEDLTGAHWPAPWRPGDVDRVLTMLAQMHPCAARFAPGFLHSQGDDRAEFASWHAVAADPEPFLALGFCPRAWLDAALPTLLHADETVVLGGTDLVHQDVRSDNLCFTSDGRTILVDWNWASVGNGAIDVSGWLPSLHLEGGPPPDAVMPDAGALAAIITGFWAARAGLPPLDFPGADRVRTLQRQQLSVALPWTARALHLPPPRPTHKE